MVYDAICDLPIKYKNAVVKAVDIILHCGIMDIAEIILFGSCARLELHVGSDIDILITTHTELADRRLTGALRGDLEFLSDHMKADVAFALKDNLYNSQEKLFQHIRNEGIILWREGEFSDEYKQFLCDSK